MVTDELVETAIETIAAVPLLAMNPSNLVDDVERLAQTWVDAEQFVRALASTQRALRQLSAKRVAGRPLSGVFEGWSSYHYQSMRTSKHPADMRIVYRYEEDVLHVLAFGHRYIPEDLYRQAGKQQRALPRITPYSRPLPPPSMRPTSRHPPPHPARNTSALHLPARGQRERVAGRRRAPGRRMPEEGRGADP